MFRLITLPIIGVLTIVSTPAKAELQLVETLCPNTTVTVRYEKTGFGSRRDITVIASKSGQTQQQQTQESAFNPGTYVLSYVFSGSGQFDVVSVYSEDLQIDRLYTNGCDE